MENIEKELDKVGNVRDVPYTTTSWGGPIEEDSDECEGTSTSRGSGTSEGADAEAGRRGKDVGGELSAGEETVAALSGRRSQRAAASQLRQKFQSGRSPRNSGGKCCS